VPKYRIYSLATASVCLGEFEAETEGAAIDMALNENPPHASLCHQCSKGLDLGDFYKEEADLVE
jgi:hypothetical protein|tara:strand:+ start:1552 stop:1743 length:192 start_codon:yes stop_codon:yes gene_type:complete